MKFGTWIRRALHDIRNINGSSVYADNEGHVGVSADWGAVSQVRHDGWYKRFFQKEWWSIVLLKSTLWRGTCKSSYRKYCVKNFFSNGYYLILAAHPGSKQKVWKFQEALFLAAYRSGCRQRRDQLQFWLQASTNAETPTANAAVSFKWTALDLFSLISLHTNQYLHHRQLFWSRNFVYLDKSFAVQTVRDE